MIAHLLVCDAAHLVNREARLQIVCRDLEELEVLALVRVPAILDEESLDTVVKFIRRVCHGLTRQAPP